MLLLESSFQAIVNLRYKLSFLVCFLVQPAKRYVLSFPIKIRNGHVPFLFRFFFRNSEYEKMRTRRAKGRGRSKSHMFGSVRYSLRNSTTCYINIYMPLRVYIYIDKCLFIYNIKCTYIYMGGGEKRHIDTDGRMNGWIGTTYP